MRRVSVIIPTLNEGQVIENLLASLAPLRAQGHEIIVSDGGSSDDTRALAAPLCDLLVHGEAGRAVQMNRAAARASGQLLWFVHADTAFATPVLDLLQAMLQAAGPWGRFDVRLDGEQAAFRLIERMMNLRSRLSGIATGDQGMFVERALFRQVGGFAELPLMEDIELSRRLRRLHRPACLGQGVLASARRWQRHGVLRTILLMWRLRLAYFLGVSPQRLAERYRQCSSPTRES